MRNDAQRILMPDDTLFAMWPDLPADYLAYLREAGPGPTANGRMIYGGPVSPQEIYGDDLAQPDVVLLGDDFAGYCLGYDLASSRYGEVAPDGRWQVWSDEQGLAHYLGG